MIAKAVGKARSLWTIEPLDIKHAMLPTLLHLRAAFKVASDTCSSVSLMVGSLRTIIKARVAISAGDYSRSVTSRHARMKLHL